MQVSAVNNEIVDGIEMLVAKGDQFVTSVVFQLLFHCVGGTCR